MKRFALTGSRLSHSYSPQIHGCILSELGLSASYELIEIPEEKRGDILEILESMGVTGFNVTIPYKTDIIGQLDFVSPEAARIGAVNTVCIRGGKSYGFNTDYDGFGRMLLNAGIDPSGKNVLVYGAGGASRALIPKLLDMGASDVTVCSRSEKRFPGLRESFPEISLKTDTDPELLSRIKERHYSLLVNATPLGMYPDRMDLMPFDEEIIGCFEAAADIVYNPADTLLLRAASSLGLKTAGGLDMLICQAVKAEEYFWDINIDPSVADAIAAKCAGITAERR